MIHFSNSDKLRAKSSKNKKKKEFMYANPYEPPFDQKIAKNKEAESIDMRYEEDIYRNMMMSNGLFDDYSGFKKKGSGFADLSDEGKRLRLITISSYTELNQTLTKLTNECIEESNGKKFASIMLDQNELLKNDYKQKHIDAISKSLDDSFNVFYRMLGFHNNGVWRKFYEYLVEGKLAHEIVYDNIEKPTRIIGMPEIDPLSIKPMYDNGHKYWVHKKDKTVGESNMLNVLYDNQITRIDWSDSGKNVKSSYLETIFRSFNMFRIMEEAQIIWTIMNSTFRTEHIIPQKGKSRKQALQSLAVEKSRLTERYEYKPESGEVFVDGEANLPFQRQIFKAEGDSGAPATNVIGGEGPNMSDTANLEFFEKKFLKSTGIPYNRFEANSSETWNMDPESTLREEIEFGNMMNRILNVFAGLILKPCLLQLYLDVPETMNDDNIINAIGLDYNTNMVFKELMEQSIVERKIRFIDDTYQTMTYTDPDGNEHNFWSRTFLINKYLPEMDNEDLKLNDKLRKEEEKMFVSEYAEMKEEYGIGLDDIDGDIEDTDNTEETDGEEQETDAEDTDNTEETDGDDVNIEM